MNVAAGDAFSILDPTWPLATGVRSVITTRHTGVAGSNIFDEKLLGLSASIPDDSDEAHTVQQARSQLAGDLGLNLPPQWLQQAHGAEAIEASANGKIALADATFTRETGLACAVLTADCLPILVSAKDASIVAAIHAGWRGLASGIVGATLSELEVDARELMVYLGPAICAQHFEVGREVRQAFLAGCMADLKSSLVSRCFRPSDVKPGHYFADLYALARAQLRALGVIDIYGGGYCTFDQTSLFYSHRRSGDVGRMASLIWIES